MARYSARLIGNMIGATARAVNNMLQERGYLDENRRTTALGEERSEWRWSENKHTFIREWDEDIAYELGDPEERLRHVNENRKAAGLDPLDSLLD